MFLEENLIKVTAQLVNRNSDSKTKRRWSSFVLERRIEDEIRTLEPLGKAQLRVEMQWRLLSETVKTMTAVLRVLRSAVSCN